MRRFLLLISGFGLGCLLLFFVTGPATVSGAAETVPLAAYPINGWRVCADLGSGSVPGVGVVRQLFRLCQGEGWQVLAYCLEVGKPPPPLNTLCSYVNGSDIWCGEAYQYLQEYDVVATAAPTFAPTATVTRTFTATATLTRTFTAIPSQTRTATAAAILTGTPISLPRASLTPRSSATAAGGDTGPNQRTRPGGPGNLALLAAGLFLVLVVLLAAVLLARSLHQARHRKARD